MWLSILTADCFSTALKSNKGWQQSFDSGWSWDARSGSSRMCYLGRVPSYVCEELKFGAVIWSRSYLAGGIVESWVQVLALEAQWSVSSTTPWIWVWTTNLSHLPNSYLPSDVRRNRYSKWCFVSFCRKVEDNVDILATGIYFFGKVNV